MLREFQLDRKKIYCGDTPAPCLQPMFGSLVSLFQIKQSLPFDVSFLVKPSKLTKLTCLDLKIIETSAVLGLVSSL